MSKYGNRKIEIDGIKFDSRAEGARYLDLRAMECAGQIEELRLQVPFVLIPKQRRADGKAERECRYVADFVYLAGGKVVVEDVKGMKTPDYVMKRKLMLHVWGISVREIVKRKAARKSAAKKETAPS